MALIESKWVDSIDSDKVNIGQEKYLKGRNAADTADQDVIKVNASDELELAKIPYGPASAPSADYQLANKKYADDGLALKLDASEKAVANGVASLDATGKVPSGQLPSYVDDVEEYADLASFPVTGETGKIYVALDTNKTYRWSGSAYVEISSSDVNSVFGRTGVVVATSGDYTTDQITEGTNKFYASSLFDTDFAGKDSGDLTEGSQLFFTDTRAKTAAVINSSAGSEIDQASSVAAMKTYVTSQIGSIQGADAEYEIATLNGTDISNGYYDLTSEALVDSIICYPVGGPVQEPGVDYTIAYTGGGSSNTRVTFSGDLASLLIATDKVAFKYLKA